MTKLLYSATIYMYLLNFSLSPSLKKKEKRIRTFGSCGFWVKSLYISLLLRNFLQPLFPFRKLMPFHSFLAMIESLWQLVSLFCYCNSSSSTVWFFFARTCFYEFFCCRRIFTRCFVLFEKKIEIIFVYRMSPQVLGSTATDSTVASHSSSDFISSVETFL